MVSTLASWLLRIIPLCCIISSLVPSELVRGNAQSATQSFTFNIDKTAFLRSQTVGGSSFFAYISAGAAVAGNNYAVAYIARGKDEFSPLAPADSPLHGAKINFLSLLGGNPIAVKDGEQVVYLYSDIQHVINKGGAYKGKTYWTNFPRVVVTNSGEVNDAASATTSEIVGLSNSISLSYTTLENGKEMFNTNSFVFVPVKAAVGGTFGDGNSGIALGLITKVSVPQLDHQGTQVRKKGKDVKTVVQSFGLLDADPSSSSTNPNRAAPFNGSLEALKITDDVSLLGDIVDVHVDQDLARAYIAVQSRSAVGGGARSIVVARVNNKKLFFDKITPDAAISGDTKIVGTKTGSTTVTAFKVRTMQTSTRLKYLIVSGGNGALGVVGNQVYAMPIVNLNQEGAQISEIIELMGDTTQGTLAKFDQTPQDVVSANSTFIQGKRMGTAATEPADLLDNSSVAAKVGAGSLPMDPATQNITDMFIQNDSVFVSIGGAYDGGTTTPGLFESEAIFDQLGRVAAWTPWKRVAGTDDKIFAASIDTVGESAGEGGLNRETGRLKTPGDLGANFWMLTGASSATAYNMRRSIWSEGNNDGLLGGTTENVSVGFVNFMTNAYPQELGGVQLLREFIDMNSNLLGIGLDKLGMLVVGGYHKMSLVQMGQGEFGDFIPTKGDFTTGAVSSNDNTFPTATSATKIMTIEGSVLDEIGVVSSSAIVSNDISGTRHYWLVVAGIGGIAVLSDDDGNGWTTPLTGLNDFPAGMSFKKLTSDRRIRKVIGANDEMYLLTFSSIKRLVLTPATIAAGTVSSTEVATPESVNQKTTTRFMDLVVSSGAVSVGVLATTKGLFRIANGHNINSAPSASSLVWTEIELPQGVGSILQLSTLSPTALDTGFGTTGQVYVLGSYHGYYASRVHRLYVNLDGAVTDTTVQLLEDGIFKGKNMFFIDFGDFRDSFWPDGGLLFHSRSMDVRSADPEQTARGSSVPLGLFSMPINKLLFNGVLPSVRSTNINLQPNDGTLLNPLIRSSALGGWLVPGDYGVRVSE